MNPIYSKLNLEQYINKVQEQKQQLTKSTLLEPTELKVLIETYDLQLSLATSKLNRINNFKEIKTGTKMHTLVFGSSPANKSAYFKTFLDKKNVFESMNYSQYVNSNCYISNHEVLSIFNIESVLFLKELVLQDTLLIKNITNTAVKKVRPIPFIIGCNFPKEKLTQEIIDRCNIIEL